MAIVPQMAHIHPESLRYSNVKNLVLSAFGDSLEMLVKTVQQSESEQQLRLRIRQLFW